MPPKPGGKLGGPWKVLAGGSFAVNGMPFAFCDAGVLPELPWAKAQLGAATPNAAIAIKDFNMIPIPFPDTVYVITRTLCGDFCNQSSSQFAVLLDCDI